MQKTERLNAIRYKKDGNTTTDSKIELMKYADNIFLLPVADKESDNPYCLVFLKISESHCWEAGNAFKNDFQILESFKKFADTSLIAEAFQSYINDNSYIKLIDIEATKILCPEKLEAMEKAREIFLEAQGQKEVALWQNKIEEEKQEKLKKQEFLQAAKQDFIAHKEITTDYFLQLAKNNMIKIHARTVGWFRDNVEKIEITEKDNARIYFKVNCNQKCKTPQKVWSSIYNLYQNITLNT